MAMKAGDKHWRNTQQIKMEFWHLEYIYKEITYMAAEMLKIFKFIFFLVENAISLRNPGKVIISRRTFYKLYELPMNSINRASKHLKSYRTNGLKC